MVGGDPGAAEPARPRDPDLARLRHAMRGVLASLQLYLGLLEIGPPERRPHYMAVLHEQVGRLAELVDQLRQAPEAGS